MTRDREVYTEKDFNIGLVGFLGVGRIKTFNPPISPETTTP